MPNQLNAESYDAKDIFFRSSNKKDSHECSISIKQKWNWQESIPQL